MGARVDAKMSSENGLKHTPGPWYSGKYIDRVTLSEESDGSDSICHVYQPSQRANARLIAASPELLAACVRVSDAIDDYLQGGQKTVLIDAYKQVSAAISKAVE